MICGGIALIYGLQSVLVEWCKNKVPICSCSWWFNASSTGPSSSVQADAEAEVGGVASDLEMRESSNNASVKASSGTKLSADLV
jgi:hypothetical protein